MNACLDACNDEITRKNDEVVYQKKKKINFEAVFDVLDKFNNKS